MASNSSSEPIPVNTSSNLSEMNDTVAIPLSRLNELQSLEVNLDIIIHDAIKKYKKDNLEKLHARDKENPSAVNERVKRYATKHREEINRRLREKRQLKRQQKLIEESMINYAIQNPLQLEPVRKQTRAPSNKKPKHTKIEITKFPLHNDAYPSITSEIIVNFDM